MGIKKKSEKIRRTILSIGNNDVDFLNVLLLQLQGDAVLANVARLTKIQPKQASTYATRLENVGLIVSKLVSRSPTGRKLNRVIKITRRGRRLMTIIREIKAEQGVE